MKNLIPVALFLIIIGSGVYYLRNKWLVSDEPPPRDQLVERLREAVQKEGELVVDPVDLSRLLGFIQHDSKDKELQLLHAQIGWRISRDAEWSAARKHLFELGSGNDRIAMDALTTIVNSPIREPVTNQDIREAALRLVQHPLCPLKSRIHAANRAMVTSSIEGQKEVVDAIIEELKDSNKVELAQWLLQFRQPQKVLELISEPEALGNGELFFLRLETQLMAGQVEEAKAFVEGNSAKLQPSVFAKAKSYLARVHQEPNPASHYIQWARDNHSMNHLVEAAEFALQSRDADTAMQAFLEVVETDKSVISDNQCGRFLQLALASRKSDQALRIMKILYERYPDKPSTLNNWLWLQILNSNNEQELEELENRAEALVNANPEMLNFHSTLAIARIFLGKIDQAIQSMNQRGDKNLQDGEKAILASALYAKGDHQKARKLDENLNELRMMPEEWNLLLKHRP